MSFEIGSPKPSDEMFYERKSGGDEHGVAGTGDEEAFRDDIVSHEELFESISEAHYLPELSGPHDEALLESLVEKGCEDNQILGQALDKLAHLVHGAGEYGDEEEDMLLSGAPVADIIDRLEQSLESPTRSSMTAAQGLLHLHHIGDHQQNAVESYIDDEVFAPDPPTLETLTPTVELEEANEVNHYDYEQNAEKRLQSNGEPAEVMYTEQVPEMHETYDNKEFEDDSQTSLTLPQQTEANLPDRISLDGNCEQESDNIMREEQETIVERPEVEEHNNLENNEASTDLISEISETVIKIEPKVEPEPVDNSDKPTDLSISVIEDDDEPPAPSTDIAPKDKPREKPEEFPRDFTIYRRLPTPHASPRIDIPRAPSRESDAMQSPQPSGIPAISSPEVFNAPQPKQKQPSFLESLYASTSPKMYTSEVTITKQQYEPLNLGKHRKSASPTVSSCSDEIRKPHKDYGEPQEKRSKRDSIDDLGKISKLLQTCDNLISDKLAESKKKKPEQPAPKPSEPEPNPSPLQQLKDLKSNKNFNIPNPLLVPKDKLNDIIMAPGIEIPALLMHRPELRLPEIFEHPNMVRDPDILVIPLEQLENIVSGSDKRELISPRHKESRSVPKSGSSTEKAIATTSTATPDPPAAAPAPVPSSSGHPKPIPSMGALADDIDAATSAALNQMLWLPYLSQLEAMAACSQNMDFLKALNSSGYTGTNYAELSQMFNHPSRFANQASFPGMSGMEYDSRMQFAMWQEAMNHAGGPTPQRHKSASAVEAQLKEMATKPNDFPSSYVQAAKASQSKSHSAARTSPIANNYTNSQRSMPHNPFLQSMYPGMSPNVRPNVPLPGLQIPYFNPNLMGSQRSPRTAQQKSPTSPYYPNNNYLQAVKPPEGMHHRDRGSSGSQESPRPRISVKSLQELQQTAAGARRTAAGSSVASVPLPPHARRRDDRDEVGSTSDPPRLPHHPHDPSSFHLWHPLFGK